MTVIKQGWHFAAEKSIFCQD